MIRRSLSVDAESISEHSHSDNGEPGLATLPIALDVKDTDYVGYNTLYTVSGRYQDVYVSDPRTAIHQPYHVDLTLRHIHHKCPVLVEKARQHRFGEDYGADYYWVEEMIKDGYPFKPILIDRALYHYDYWPQYSMGKGSAQRNVGIWPFDASKFTWVE